MHLLYSGTNYIESTQRLGQRHDWILMSTHTAIKLSFAANDCDKVILLDWFCRSAVAVLSQIWSEWAISPLLTLCVGNHRSPMNSPHKKKVTSTSLYSMTQNFDTFFDVRLNIYGWTNRGVADGLRCHDSHCVMRLWWRHGMSALLVLFEGIRRWLPPRRATDADRLSC